MFVTRALVSDHGIHSSPVATFYVPGTSSGDVELSESAAHHANVKRLAVGDVVRITNGAGTRVLASISSLARKRLVVASWLVLGVGKWSAHTTRRARRSLRRRTSRFGHRSAIASAC